MRGLNTSTTRGARAWLQQCRTKPAEHVPHALHRCRAGTSDPARPDTWASFGPLQSTAIRTASLVHVSEKAVEVDEKKIDREERILDAVLALLSQHGISGVSMRAVAREAGVSLGLVNYYYADKTTLIGAALRRIEEQDVAMVEPDPAKTPEENLRAAFRRVANAEFLTTEYLSLRLQLWALAQANPQFDEINTAAQKRYRKALAALIHSARPELGRPEANKRAADIDIVQNGMWLTALLGLDRASIRRSVALCEDIAFQ